MRWKLNKILNKFKGLFSSDQASCRIVEINTSSQEVVFHFKYKAVFLRCKLTEAIADLSVIDNLIPWEACWLGGYYGRALRASIEGREALKKAKRMSFLLKNNRGRYRIVFQNRTGEIGYFDQKTKQEFIEHPLTVANNEHIISEFDPSQACYIGILAGISMEKTLSSDKKTGEKQLETLINKPPKLRIVK
jgi:hypothetical protein